MTASFDKALLSHLSLPDARRSWRLPRSPATSNGIITYQDQHLHRNTAFASDFPRKGDVAFGNRVGPSGLGPTMVNPSIHVSHLPLGTIPPRLQPVWGRTIRSERAAAGQALRQRPRLLSTRDCAFPSLIVTPQPYRAHLYPRRPVLSRNSRPIQAPRPPEELCQDPFSRVQPVCSAMLPSWQE